MRTRHDSRRAARCSRDSSEMRTRHDCRRAARCCSRDSSEDPFRPYNFRRRSTCPVRAECTDQSATGIQRSHGLARQAKIDHPQPFLRATTHDASRRVPRDPRLAASCSRDPIEPITCGAERPRKKRRINRHAEWRPFHQRARNVATRLARSLGGRPGCKSRRTSRQSSSLSDAELPDDSVDSGVVSKLDHVGDFAPVQPTSSEASVTVATGDHTPSNVNDVISRGMHGDDCHEGPADGQTPFFDKKLEYRVRLVDAPTLGIFYAPVPHKNALTKATPPINSPFTNNTPWTSPAKIGEAKESMKGALLDEGPTRDISSTNAPTSNISIKIEEDSEPPSSEFECAVIVWQPPRTWNVQQLPNLTRVPTSKPAIAPSSEDDAVVRHNAKWYADRLSISPSPEVLAPSKQGDINHPSPHDLQPNNATNQQDCVRQTLVPESSVSPSPPITLEHSSEQSLVEQANSERLAIEPRQQGHELATTPDHASESSSSEEDPIPKRKVAPGGMGKSQGQKRRKSSHSASENASVGGRKPPALSQQSAISSVASTCTPTTTERPTSSHVDQLIRWQTSLSIWTAAPAATPTDLPMMGAVSGLVAIAMTESHTALPAKRKPTREALPPKHTPNNPSPLRSSISRSQTDAT